MTRNVAKSSRGGTKGGNFAKHLSRYEEKWNPANPYEEFNNEKFLDGMAEIYCHIRSIIDLLPKVLPEVISIDPFLSNDRFSEVGEDIASSMCEKMKDDVDFSRPHVRLATAMVVKEVIMERKPHPATCILNWMKSCEPPGVLEDTSSSEPPGVLEDTSFSDDISDYPTLLDDEYEYSYSNYIKSQKQNFISEWVVDKDTKNAARFHIMPDGSVVKETRCESITKSGGVREISDEDSAKCIYIFIYIEKYIYI
eukprot:GHVL01039453.1.p1 GENE.GHVL01039453.1~~GHVL01039453.1.p1  ORF type:complete len:253 (+),score=51.75 GHVL01039453.1:47-805(+)